MKVFMAHRSNPIRDYESKVRRYQKRFDKEEVFRRRVMSFHAQRSDKNTVERRLKNE